MVRQETSKAKTSRRPSQRPPLRYNLRRNGTRASSYAQDEGQTVMRVQQSRIESLQESQQGSLREETGIPASYTPPQHQNNLFLIPHTAGLEQTTITSMMANQQFENQSLRVHPSETLIPEQPLSEPFEYSPMPMDDWEPFHSFYFYLEEKNSQEEIWKPKYMWMHGDRPQAWDSEDSTPNIQSKEETGLAVKEMLKSEEVKMEQKTEKKCKKDEKMEGKEVLEYVDDLEDFFMPEPQVIGRFK